MKTSKLALLFGTVGILISLGSYYRWVVQYVDHSQAALGIGGGLGILFCAYVYNYLRRNDYNLARMQSQLDAIGALVTGNKKEALEEEAAGIGREEA